MDSKNKIHVNKVTTGSDETDQIQTIDILSPKVIQKVSEL